MGPRNETLEQGIDRDRGILTKADREFLTPGMEGMPDTQNARNQKRYRIRNRICESLRDFLYLLQLSDEDYRLIEEEYRLNTGTPGVSYGVFSAVEFFYRLIGEFELLKIMEILIAEDRKQDRPAVYRVNLNVEIEEVENLELAETAVEIMKEHDDGSGVKTEDVVETLVARENVSQEEARQAIEGALFTGKCYEPEDGILKPN